MTDRYNAFTVVLSVDMRSDDAQKVRDAIGQIKNVESVEPNVTNVADTVARSRIVTEVSNKLIDFIKELNKF